jgi:tetratricopeptide (TPR) repeat protein
MAASSAPAKDNWISLRTKNFNIVSNGDERDTRQLALKLEQFRMIISRLTNTSLVAPVPITVVVFKSDGSFKPFKPLYNGKPSNAAGFFQRSEDENLIALDMNARTEHPMAVIFHEYTHLFTAYTPIAWPMWLREGVAEFYSTFDVKKNEVSIGKPVTHHVLLLRQNKFVPLETLFSVERNSPIYNERDKQGVFYAESWALVHYLMYGNNHARQQQLIQFILALGRGANVERAFSEVFKSDFAAMEKELRRYIGKDSYPGMIFTMDSTEGEKDVSVRPISDAEVQYNLGNLLMRINRLEDAEPYFSQAIALDPKLAGPWEGRGFIAMRRNRYSEAKDHLKQAVALGSQNHLVHYYYAESLQRELMGDRGSVSVIQQDLAQTMIDELKTSIRLMPGFAPAYNLLAFVYLASGEKLSEGVETMKAALKLEPQNRRFALRLAQLQMRMQDYAAAKKTLEPLLAGDDEAGVKAQAQSILSLIDSYSRRDISASSVQSVLPPSSSSPESREPPRLKRKGDEAGDSAESTRDNTDRVFSSAKPTTKFEGTEVMAGTLAVIECGSGMVLAVKAGEKLLRFSVTDPNKLQFLTQDPKLNRQIGCGAINLAAFIHYKPTSGGQFAGDAVAVEFRK